MTTITKATTKGQITLPAQWRKLFETDRYLMKQEGNKLIISPIHIDDIEDEWETVFDAKRDNKGKAVPAKALIKALKDTL